MHIKEEIINLYEKIDYSNDDRKIFDEFIELLNKGKIRSAEYDGKNWNVNEWVKKGILLGFKMGKIVKSQLSNNYSFTDKDTYGVQQFNPKRKIRMVPGGTSVRDGAYIANGVTIMPPAYINAGAFVDESTMIDSHALVGSCAQVGKRVHLSASAQLGGVLEPIKAKPVIIEDDVFIGGNCGIYEGIIVKKRAIIAAGVVMTSSTPIFDAVNNEFLSKKNDSLIIPEGAVIVSGSRKLKSNPDFQIYCPIIIKYRDKKTDSAVKLEDYLRS